LTINLLAGIITSDDISSSVIHKEGVQVTEKLADLGHFSDPSLFIMASLAAGPRHGYAMMEDIEAFAQVRLGPGTLYGALARLEQRGWIEPLPAEDRRRPYRLTAAGAVALREQLTSLEQVAALGLRRLATL
jgi:DNA-binding PadR family transcriptional regulator